MASRRCPKDGTFMARLTPASKWWTCRKLGCGRLENEDPRIDNGMALMGLWR